MIYKLLFCIGLAIGLACSWVANAHADTTLDQMASAMVGAPVSVECVAMTDENGKPNGNDGQTFYHINDDGTLDFEMVIQLSFKVCEALETISRHTYYADEGYSIAVMLHESLHIRMRSNDEGLVECTTMANLWPMIKTFGFGSSLNKKLYVNAWEDHIALPDNYIKGCKTPPAAMMKTLTADQRWEMMGGVTITLVSPIKKPKVKK